MSSKPNFSKEDALAFILQYIVIEKGLHFELNPTNLFTLTNLAADAETKLRDRDQGIIRHELIEDICEAIIPTLT